MEAKIDQKSINKSNQDGKPSWHRFLSDLGGFGRPSWDRKSKRGASKGGPGAPKGSERPSWGGWGTFWGGPGGPKGVRKAREFGQPVGLCVEFNYRYIFMLILIPTSR